MASYIALHALHANSGISCAIMGNVHNSTHLWKHCETGIVL